MKIGQVIGTLVATQKDPNLEGLRFQVLKTVSADGIVKDEYVVAVDAVGAGVGEYVLYASGSSARQTVLTNNRPVDAVIMAIVDSWEVNGHLIYQKH
jgi:ethanolamine utilization protein EutN/carbon dioxide concentrating mechanism protein CcmL